MIKNALTLALLAPLHVLAAASCQETPLDNSRTPEIVVAQRQAAHLEFPEAIVRPVLGDAQQWQIAAYAETPTHLWITPTAVVAPDQSTTLTVLTESGAYDFIIRHGEAATACYRFYFEQAIATLALQPMAPSDSVAQVQATPLPSPGRYRWRSDAIADVRDDGRFTYVTLAEPPRRLPALTDESGGPVNAEWQASTHTFRVVGLFDALRIHLGRRPIDIKRES